MTRLSLLDALKEFTLDVTKDLLLPVSRQKEDVSEPPDRPAAVHLMNLPDMAAYKKKAPYIIHKLQVANDEQPQGLNVEASAAVRSVFCVYCADAEQGGLLLLNLIERLRIALLKKVVIANQFMLNLQQGLQVLIYDDGTDPYFAGEMYSVWRLPHVEREVELWQQRQNLM